MNGLCGDGSLESVFDYWGPDINQKAIANVARSSSIGTWAFDIRRAGHFSELSAAQGNYFPHKINSGVRQRPLGYAAFWRVRRAGAVAGGVEVAAGGGCAGDPAHDLRSRRDGGWPLPVCGDRLR